ncbi:MAG TPA: cadherin-like domain-containing protein [Rhodocyclaceae bacterium]
MSSPIPRSLVHGRHPLRLRRTAAASGLMALEPRIMFDGAAAAAVVDKVVANPAAAGTAKTADAAIAAKPAADAPFVVVRGDMAALDKAPAGTRHEVVVVDATVKDWQTLVAGMDPSIPVIVLHPDAQGMGELEELSAFLSQHHNLDAIHLVSEGRTGALLLGSELVYEGDLQVASPYLAEIGAALKPGGDLLLYGCSVAGGSGGKQFVDDLARTLGNGVDVAASTDRTGPSALGGDWDLEYSTGNVDTVLPFTLAGMQDISHCLGCVTGNMVAGATLVSNNEPDFVSKTTALQQTYSWQQIINTTNAAHHVVVAYQVNYFSSNYIFTRTANLGGTVNSGNQMGVADLATYTNLYPCTHDFFPNTAPSFIGATTLAVLPNSGATDIRPLLHVSDSDGSQTETWTQQTAPDHGGSLSFSGPDNTAPSGSTDITPGGTITYTPAAGFTGIETFTVKVDDGNGGTATRTITVTVNAAPTGLGDVTLAAVAEDTASPAGAAINTLSGLNFQDTGTGASLSGVAVVGNTADSGTQGAWQYSTNGGTNWFAVGTVGDGANALALSAGTLVRFVPVANYYGTPASLTVRAVDNSYTGSFSTTAGSESRVTLNTTSNGGTTAIAGSTNAIGTSITAVNDAPVVGASGGTTAFTEGNNAASTPVAVDAGLTVADVDNATLASATVSITANFQSGQDVLAFTNDGSTMGNIGGSYNAGTGVLTLTSSGASATLAQWQAALRSITYTNTSDSPNTSARTVSFAINDGAATGNTATKNVSVTAVNDTPVVGMSGGTTAFTEGDNVNSTPVAVDAGLTVNDLDNGTLSSATVSITTNFQSGQDVLAFTNDGSTMGNVGGSYNAGTGVLTLTSTGASATLAQWQAALRSVTYTNSSDSPNTSTRTVSFVLNDGTANGNTGTKDVSVTAVNDTPTIATNAGLTVLEGATDTITTAALSISDLDTAATSRTLTIGTAPAHGTLYKSGIAMTAGSTFTQDDIANNRISYTHDGGETTADSFTFTVSDGAGGTIGATTFNLSITPVNDAPTVAAGGTLAYTEGSSAAAIDGTVTLADADNATLASAAVTLSSGFSTGDVLGFTNQNGITGSYNAGTGVLTLTGAASIANYQAALRSVTFRSTSNDPTAVSASRTITWLVSDGALAGAATSTINITAVNNAPVATAGGTLSYTENGAAAAIDGTLTLSDADDTQLTGATVSIGSGLTSGDLLGFTNQNGISGNYNAGTGVLTLTGTASVANYQTALRSVTFSSSSDNPTATAASRSVSWSVTDANSDGAGAQTSSSVTSTVNITAVNDLPVVANLNGDNISFSIGGSAVQLDAASNATVSDPDSANFNGGSVSASISANGQAAEDLLSVANVGGITVSGANVSDGGTVIGTWSGGSNGTALVIALNTNATPARVQDLVRALQYQDTDAGTVNTASRTVAVTVNDGSGTSATQNVTVGLVRAPIIDLNGAAAGSGYGTTFTEGGGAVAIADAAASISDDGTIDLMTVTVTNLKDGVAESLSSTLGSGVQTVGGQSVTIGAYNSATGSLTITGTHITAANMATVLQSIRYNNTSDAPDTTARSIAVSATDNDGNAGNASTTTLAVAATNDAPTVTVPGSINVTEDVASAITGISFADVDAGGGTVTATLGVDSGTLAAASGGGVTVGGSGTASLTLSGTVANINAFISGSHVSFTTAADATASVTLTASIDDGGNTGSGGAKSASDTTTFSVSAVNDAPTIAAPASINVAGAGAPITGLVFADVDAGGGSVTVTLGANSLGTPTGSLSATSHGGVTVGGNGTPNMTLTGSIADINAFIAGGGVTFDNTANLATPFTLAVGIDDGGNTGSGGAKSAACTIVLTPNTAPTAAGGTITLSQNGSYTFGVADFHFSDADAGDALQQVKITGLPTQGVLMLDGATVSSGQVIAVADITAGKLKYQAETGGIGDLYASFQFKVGDGKSFSDAAYTMAAGNTAPTGADGTIGLWQNGSYTFAAADFHFSDADAGDTLQQVQITSVPTHGALTLDGVALGSGQIVTQADIAAGKLKFVPATGGSGDGYATFQFKVGDGKSFSNAAYTMTANVTALPPLQPLPPPIEPPRVEPPPAPPWIPPAPLPPPEALSHPIEPPVVPSGDTTGGRGDIGLPPAPPPRPQTETGSPPLTRSDGFQVPVLRSGGGGAEPTLLIVRPMADQSVGASSPIISIQVPHDVFAHTSADATIALSASLADGRALPGWLHFDPVRGTFEGVVPPGLRGDFTIRLTAMDNQGHRVVTTFHIRVGASGDSLPDRGGPRAAVGKPSLAAQFDRFGMTARNAGTDKLVATARQAGAQRPGSAARA